MKNGSVIWLIGLTLRGKTTIADAFLKKIEKYNIIFFNIDGDEICDLMGPNHSFLEDDHFTVVKGMVHFSNKILNKGFNIIASALTAHEISRQYIKDHIDNLILIFIKCDIGECIKRDPKGPYKQAIEGEIDTLIGYNTPYLELSQPDFTINTSETDIDEAVNMIINTCLGKNRISLWEK